MNYDPISHTSADQYRYVVERYMFAVATFLIRGKRLVTVRTRRKGLRFRCRRCGIFCCLLGGPAVTSDDLTRLRKTHPGIGSATETIRLGTGPVTIIETKPNGECIFYSSHAGKGACDIYENRPDVCKTYPFRLARKGNRLTVFLLPCLGLNTEKGSLLSENFFSKYLRFANAA